jgi:hypothetical protein
MLERLLSTEALHPEHFPSVASQRLRRFSPQPILVGITLREEVITTAVPKCS